MESALEFLASKGFRKVHQLNQRYNLTLGELVEFLNEFAYKETKSRSENNEQRLKPELNILKHRRNISKQVNS